MADTSFPLLLCSGCAGLLRSITNLTRSLGSSDGLTGQMVSQLVSMHIWLERRSFCLLSVSQHR